MEIPSLKTPPGARTDEHSRPHRLRSNARGEHGGEQRILECLEATGFRWVGGALRDRPLADLVPEDLEEGHLVKVRVRVRVRVRGSVGVRVSG